MYTNESTRNHVLECATISWYANRAGDTNNVFYLNLRVIVVGLYGGVGFLYYYFIDN